MHPIPHGYINSFPVVIRISIRGVGDGAEHLGVFTMDLAPSPRDTRITYTKVDSILYVCLLGSLEDGTT